MPTEQEENRIDALVERLDEEGRIDALDEELERLKPGRLTAAERESWYTYWGIAAYQRDDRPEALRRFTAAFEACPESGEIAFSLGQEHQHAGDADGMFNLFDRFPFPQVAPNYARFQARYAYLWNHPDKAITYLMPLIDQYHALGIADDNFLHMRGMPFFGVVWSSLGAYFELTGDLETFRRLTETAAKRLSDYSFDSLRGQLTAVISGEFSAHLSNLTASLTRMRKYGAPTGYTEMRIAIIAGRSADPAAAEDRLAAVRLTRDDFPWLEDMRTLARARIAHAAGDEAREADLRDTFMARQPLLFEPEHVFDFRLVDYQQRLTPLYRRERGAPT